MTARAPVRVLVYHPDEAREYASLVRAPRARVTVATCATPSETFFRTFLRTRCDALFAGALAMLISQSNYFFSAAAPLRGPLRVRALVRVRWPRMGRPRRWRKPR